MQVKSIYHTFWMSTGYSTGVFCEYGNLKKYMYSLETEMFAKKLDQKNCNYTFQGYIGT